ncbi:hypothetical protein T265_00360 [Opisthorchis viverrini]|uniref:CHCH domain protein n=1 Tax=Opisthorchis viverrini TaxID=6198 RepID=A0A075A2H5_OPIVI|nr:hypothetical protein T265_00360 [Opisthorchis viverrini]KER33923.1 hypothetical protein T265_00360 [Opisthorchis viverrini]
MYVDEFAEYSVYANMGGVFSSDDTRDVIFLPEDIIVSPAAQERLKKASLPGEPPGKNEELFKQAAEEYTRTVERLENKYMRSTPGGCCTAAEQRVEDCYKSNPGRPLQCSQLVKEYIRCVNNFRVATARKEVSSPA